MSARVVLERRRLWSVRASLALGRWLLYGLALAGIAISVRDLARPRPPGVRAPSSAPAANLEAQWFALRFARAYMTFTADPAVRERALAPFIASGGDPDAGATPAGGQRVVWAQIAAERDLGAQRDYTVAITTGTGALRYLVVALTPAPGGGETLAHYPALVAAPVPVPAGPLDGAVLPGLPGGALATVIERALRNYLAGSTENLAADLAPGAIIAPAEPGLQIQAVQRLAVQPTGRVLATLLASDRAGDRLTLDYRVGARLEGGRWLVTSIEP
jgi:Conjugative transposon protein TcpC